MVKAIIRIDEKMDKGIEYFSKEWNLNKDETIEKIVRTWLEQQK